MNAAASATAQRATKLEKQRMILQKKLQHKHAQEVLSLQAKTFKSALDFNSTRPRSATNHASHKSVPEKFAYDGPQAFALGNPDLLDPPIQVLRINADTDEVISGKSTSLLRELVEYEPIHIPPVRPVKLPLSETPSRRQERKTRFNNPPVEEKDVNSEENLKRNFERARGKTSGQRQLKGNHRLRPHSAAELVRPRRVPSNTLIDVCDVDMIFAEKSGSHVTADRSATPSTTSWRSLQWREMAGPAKTKYKEGCRAVGDQTATKSDKKKPPKSNTVDATKLTTKVRTRKRQQKIPKSGIVKQQTTGIDEVACTNEPIQDEISSKISRLFSAVDDVEAFIASPAPEGMTVRCRISRDKHGLERGLFPSYFLHLEREVDNRRFFLLAARRSRAASCNYMISLDASVSANMANVDRHLIVGKVRSNFLGTHFTLTSCSNVFPGGECPVYLLSNSREIAAVDYEPNILGFKGPRRMTVLIPKLSEQGHSENSDGTTQSLSDWGKSGHDSSRVIELHNKKPMWNEETQSYVLNFQGRVTRASVKNFQLINEDCESTIIMQFGRISSDTFTMDYTYPLTALQAFGITISSLTGKLACE